MASSERLISLDVFRGFTVAMMILVNTPGSWDTVYAPFLHAPWHGATPTDMIFPFFLFIVGVSISLAFAKALEKNTPKFILFRKIFKRCAILFGLGLFLNTFPQFDILNIRILGVLQRISIVFMFCATFYILFSEKTIFGIGIGILIGYWILMTFVPIPTIGAPNLEPTTNLAAWIDQQILGIHVWKNTKLYDPEGILSTLPAIVTGIIGMLTGNLTQQKNMETSRKVMILLGAGIILIISGLIWDIWFPINKQLWTSSYVLFSGGVALWVLGISIYLIDVLNYQNFFTKFCIIFGSNAITVYVLSGVLISILYAIPVGDRNLQDFIYKTLFVSWLNPYSASLFFAISYTLFCFIPVWIMYQKRIFIKI